MTNEEKIERKGLIAFDNALKEAKDIKEVKEAYNTHFDKVSKKISKINEIDINIKNLKEEKEILIEEAKDLGVWQVDFELMTGLKLFNMHIQNGDKE